MLITIPEFRITINWTEKDKRLPKVIIISLGFRHHCGLIGEEEKLFCSISAGQKVTRDMHVQR